MKTSSNSFSMDIVVLGLRGFPDAFSAKINRYRSITNMLQKAGHSTLVLNRDVTGKREVTERSGIVIKSCLQTSLSSYTLRKFFRYFLFLFEFVKLLNWAVKSKKKKLFIVYTSSLSLFVWYVFISKILNVKIVYDYVEKRTGIKERYQSKWNLFQDKVFEHHVLKWSNGFFVISDYLKGEVEKRYSSKLFYKLPPICDFDYFRNIKADEAASYILYCGSYGYKDVIDFVVKAYIEADVSDQLSLFLVINGGKNEISSLKEELNQYPAIKVYTRLDYDDLIKKYKSAKALLIPLRNIIQDYARFPQKVCEYLASEGLILSSETGEMANYFEHEKSALLARSFDTRLYADLIRKLTVEEAGCKLIRQEAWRIGIKYFNEGTIYKDVSNFLEKV